VKLADLPISFTEIKDAVFELATRIQLQDQGFDLSGQIRDSQMLE
jgi:hypothetical protein